MDKTRAQYPREFREPMVALARSGRTADAHTAIDPLSAGSLHDSNNQPKLEMILFQSLTVEEDVKSNSGTLFTKKVGVDHTCLTAA